MANKLFLVSVTLAFFFLLTNASIYRTVIEFDEDDATNRPRPHPKCQKEFQQAQHLRACQQWINKKVMQPGGGPSLALDDEFDSEDDMENTQELTHCCNELREVEPVCVCPTLKEAARSVRLQGQHGPYQASRIFQTAKHLPEVCKIQQVGVCPFRSTPFFPPSY